LASMNSLAIRVLKLLASRPSALKFQYRLPFNGIDIARHFNTIKYPPPPSYFEHKANKGKRPRRKFRKYMLFFVVGAVISYNYSIHELVEMLLDTLPDNKLEAKAYEEKLESRLQDLKVVKKLSKDERFVQTRSWESFNTISKLPIEEYHSKKNPIIHESLTEPGGIAIAPLVFNDAENRESHVIIHLGKRLAGYPLIVHGGVLGLMVDEVFKKSCAAEFGVLDVNKLHTEKSVLNYRSPTFVNTFALFETKCEALGDDKYKVTGTVTNAKTHRKLIDAEVTIKKGKLPDCTEETTQQKLAQDSKGRSSGRKRSWLLWA